MGADKALLELSGFPLITWALLMLKGAGLEVWIAGARNPELASFAPLIADAWEDAGPLGGVCSALRQTQRDWAVFVTVDQPLMAPALLIGLLDRARAGQQGVTLASIGGVAQTFPAVVQRAALAVLEGKVEKGQLGCMAAFRAAGLQVVAAEDLVVPESRSLIDRWFSNVNTPEDLERVRQQLG
jgi:molybdopterin-guanine dinucleotide biosynthesis protein A